MPANKAPLGDKSCLQGSSLISGKGEKDTFTDVKLLLQKEKSISCVYKERQGF